MKVKWIIESDFPLGTQGKIYDVLGQCTLGKTKRVTWYKITNDIGGLVGFLEVILR